MFNRLYRRIYRHVAELQWYALVLIAAGHFLSSWALIRFVEQSSLTGPDVFWYYYLVTATTVGYGDFAPTTVLGRVIAVLWIMPGGIAIFTAAIAKAAQAAAESWRRNMRGGGDYSKLDNHIILIGWRGERSERLLDQLADAIDDATPSIVIISDKIAQNPAPDRAQFIRAETISDRNAFTRAGIKTANAAVVMALSDADALAGSLAAAALAPDLRLVVYFEDEQMSELLKAHCPTAETVPSLSIELLARAARDSGSAELMFKLASSQVGPTEYSMVVPESAPTVLYGDAMLSLKQQHNATLLGVRPKETQTSILNPEWSSKIQPGDRIYYVNEARLRADAIDWQGIEAMAST
ncbi:MAG: potassium channel family protein [Alphaproteobacteria bacterium]